MRGTRLTELEFMLLNALITEGRTHPYALGRATERRTGIMVVTLGALYKALHRLEEAGYVESEWESVDPAEAGRPRRKLYEITGLGQTVAAEAGRLRAAMFSQAGGLAWQA